MRWNRIANSSLAFSAHTLLFCFTILLILKIDHQVPYSWWIIFFPLFLFHAVVVRGRFSLPGLSISHGHHVALIAFELLLCHFLESAYGKKPSTISLKIVFLPLLAVELTILFENLRMCKALLPGVDEILGHDAIWEPLLHFLIAISMGFFFAGTVFTLRKLSGYISSLGWWNLFIYFGIAECFAFLVWTMLSNSVIHRNFQIPASSTEDISENRMCGLQDKVGHVMKILIIVFQILLCMRLEGKPAAARFIPLPILFSPIYSVQGLGVLFAASNLIKNILLHTGAYTGIYFTYAARARASFGFLQRGSRLLVWWTTDERSQEEQPWMHYNGSSGYNTFSGYPPEIVERPKKDLTEEVRRLRVALTEQTKITKSSQQNDETPQNEKLLCRICFEREIDTVLLPCRHHSLCSICSKKCPNCPFCRAVIEKRLPVYGV